MNAKQKVILKALIELSESEKQEVIREAERFSDRSFSERGALNESFEKAARIMGPISGDNCPCCGK